mmetsp:Transcript_27065/g.65788  ORF Transcript_27065/g.65788 Transcript_27065/m.65788 type:complete len:233 (-) Transcript_27065:835-1533(-)
MWRDGLPRERPATCFPALCQDRPPALDPVPRLARLLHPVPALRLPAGIVDELALRADTRRHRLPVAPNAWPSEGLVARPGPAGPQRREGEPSRNCEGDRKFREHLLLHVHMPGAGPLLGARRQGHERTRFGQADPDSIEGVDEALLGPAKVVQAYQSETVLPCGPAERPVRPVRGSHHGGRKLPCGGHFQRAGQQASGRPLRVQAAEPHHLPEVRERAPQGRRCPLGRLQRD